MVNNNMLQNLEKYFQLPISTIHKSYSIDDNIRSDLELTEKDDNLYNVLFQPSNQYAEETIQQWNKYYTDDKISASAIGTTYDLVAADESEQRVDVILEQLAYARSGDKGDNANIGIIARKPEYLPYLSEQLSAAAVAEYFAHTVKGDVTRYDMPGFNAFNFFSYYMLS